ncbi:MAG TPA: hypothetical protein VMP89_06790 [Solirubrobacteraceae bacterium]|nr:hypothetical protein [Solirubrobacteraceae bacterium]
MSRVPVALGALVAALVLAAPAIADQSVTATGTAQVKVTPKNRHSNSSIGAAIQAAHKAGISGALDEAHEYALQYAQAAGLTLGSVQSVSDASSNGFGYYGPGFFFGPFGPNQFCGETSRPVFKVVNGKRKLKGFKRVHTCFVPPFEAVSLTVTYSAT